MRGTIPENGVLVLFSNKAAYRKVSNAWGEAAFRRTPEFWRWRRRSRAIPSSIQVYHPSDWNLEPLGEVFIFDDPKDTMMFKLAWGA